MEQDGAPVSRGIGAIQLSVAQSFEVLLMKEISERRKLAEVVEELKREIEAEKADKEFVKVKLKEIGERGDELESLGGYLEMKAVQVREGEEELEKKRKEVDERFLEQFRLREAKFEEELAEFKRKQAEFEVRVVELNAKEREFDEKVKQCREPEMNPRPCSYDLMERKLQEQFDTLSKRMDELELKRVKDLESIEKKVEMMSGETLVEDKRPDKSLDHSSEANIRHCVITSGNDAEMTEKQVEMTTREIAIEAKKPAESLNRSSEVNIRLCAAASGKDLQIFMNEHANDYDSVKDEVENVLKRSSNPAKLVLDAMEGFYPPRLMKGGVQFEEAVVRNNCLMLLEWLTKMSPYSKPEVKKEAKKLAFDWKNKMKSDAEHSLEVLVFLQLLAAFELARDFWWELEKMLSIVAHYSQAPLLLRDLNFHDEMAIKIEMKLLTKENQAEAARLISALELDSEFPSVISPEIHRKEFNLAPLLGNTVPVSSSNTVLSGPELQTQSHKCSGAKRSWSDACAEDNHTEYPGPAHLPDRSNVAAQQPERSSSDHGKPLINTLLF